MLSIQYIYRGPHLLKVHEINNSRGFSNNVRRTGGLRNYVAETFYLGRW